MHYDIEILSNDGEPKHLGCVDSDIIPREGDSMTLVGSPLSSQENEAVLVVVTNVQWFVKFDGSPVSGSAVSVIVELAECERPGPQIFCVCRPEERSVDPNYSSLCDNCGDMLRQAKVSPLLSAKN